MYLDTHVMVWLYQGDLGRLIVAQARVGGEKLLTKDTASLEHTDLAVWD
jgi:PIN domain nuclease of toxin-antitoxin system